MYESFTRKFTGICLNIVHKCKAQNDMSHSIETFMMHTYLFLINIFDATFPLPKFYLE